MKPSIFENNKTPIEAIEKWRIAYPALDFVVTANDCREIIHSYLNDKIDAELVTAWATSWYSQTGSITKLKMERR